VQAHVKIISPTGIIVRPVGVVNTCGQAALNPNRARPREAALDVCVGVVINHAVLQAVHLVEIQHQAAQGGVDQHQLAHIRRVHTAHFHAPDQRAKTRTRGAEQHGVINPELGWAALHLCCRVAVDAFDQPQGCFHGFISAKARLGLQLELRQGFAGYGAYTARGFQMDDQLAAQHRDALVYLLVAHEGTPIFVVALAHQP